MNPAAAMSALAVIVASVREGRFGPVVADWFVGRAKQRDDLSADVIDLADTPIPSTNFTSPIGAADAFVVTPSTTTATTRPTDT
ncbi:MAG: NADPH-dependent FMN reductase [Pseudonocardiaceae bacterium]